MSTIAELEQLLHSVRFRPPPVLPSGPRPPPTRPQTRLVAALLAVAAVASTILLLFTFWRLLVRLSS